MKIFTLIFLISVLSFGVLATEAEKRINGRNLTTITGKTYEFAILKKVTLEGIYILHKDGKAFVRHSYLPDDIKKVLKPDIDAIKERIKDQQEEKERRLDAAKKAQKQEELALLKIEHEAVKPALDFYNSLQNAKDIFTNKNSHSFNGPIHKSVVFIKGDKGSGTGFYANLWGKNVVLTNAHVYAGLRNISVYDTNDEEYSVISALLAKDRDLAILEVVPPEKASPLALDYQVANIPFRQRLNIYGNSLGKGIITNLSGLFQGIGATEIEIADSDFVSGNSGSPVVSFGSRKVIGIATYIEKLTKSDWTVKGTRFDPDSITSEPRRFATRIDNIKVEDIEPLNPLKQDEDLCIIRQMDAVLASLVLKATTSSTASFKEFLKEKYLDLENSGAFTHKWGSVYMRNKYDKASGFINALAEILKIDLSGKKSFAVSDAAYGYYKERLYSDGKNVIDLGEALNDFKKSDEYRRKVLALFPENRDEFKVMNVDVFQVIDSRNILARVNGIQHIKFLIDHKLYDGQIIP